jgi:hypothetical protein
MASAASIKASILLEGIGTFPIGNGGFLVSGAMMIFRILWWMTMFFVMSLSANIAYVSASY